MADNVEIDPGSTTPIATEDVSGVHVQKMLVLASGGAGSIVGGLDAPVGGKYLPNGSNEVAALAVADAGSWYLLDEYIARSVSGIYAAGDAIGTVDLLTTPLAGGTYFTLRSLVVSDLEQQHPEFDIYFVASDSDQTSTVTDNQPYLPDANEVGGITMLARVRDADYVDVGSYAMAHVESQAQGFLSDGYAVVIVAASAYTATGDGFQVIISGGMA